MCFLFMILFAFQCPSWVLPFTLHVAFVSSFLHVGLAEERLGAERSLGNE